MKEPISLGTCAHGVPNGILRVFFYGMTNCFFMGILEHLLPMQPAFSGSFELATRILKTSLLLPMSHVSTFRKLVARFVF
jgi:hypothetical protein